MHRPTLDMMPTFHERTLANSPVQQLLGEVQLTHPYLELDVYSPQNRAVLRPELYQSFSKAAVAICRE